MNQNIRFAAAHGTTAAQAMVIMNWLLDYVTNYVPSPLTILAVTVAAVTKKGTVTDEWIIRYVEGINTDVGSRIQVSRVTP